MAPSFFRLGIFFLLFRFVLLRDLLEKIGKFARLVDVLLHNTSERPQGTSSVIGRSSPVGPHQMIKSLSINRPNMYNRFY